MLVFYIIGNAEALPKKYGRPVCLSDIVHDPHNYSHTS
jgi:hypothetical protein